MKRNVCLLVAGLCLLAANPIGIRIANGEREHKDYGQVVRERDLLRSQNEVLQRRIQSLENDNASLKTKAKFAEIERNAAQAFAKTSPAGQAQQLQETQAKRIASLEQQVRELQSVLDNLRRGKSQFKIPASQPTSQPMSQPTSRPL